jgi:hypothetical protein
MYVYPMHTANTSYSTTVTLAATGKDVAAEAAFSNVCERSSCLRQHTTATRLQVVARNRGAKEQGPKVSVRLATFACQHMLSGHSSTVSRPGPWHAGSD